MIGQLEYTKALLNTALSAGDQKSVDDKKAEIALLENLIKAQQDLIPPDPFYTEAVDTIQKTLDQQQKTMQEDRESASKALDAAQQSFAQNAPEVDKLPAEQKFLASEMEKRVAEFNAAHRNTTMRPARLAMALTMRPRSFKIRRPLWRRPSRRISNN